MTNPNSVINEEAETKAIEKWLRMVDKPLETKRTGQSIDSRDKNEAMHQMQKAEHT